MTNFKIIFIHGYTASSTADWYPSISSLLQSNDVDFSIPDLPGGEHPHAADWLHIIHNEVISSDKPLVLVSHSLGTRTALLYLEKYQPYVEKVFLIAAFANNTDNARRKNGFYSDFFKHTIDLKKIKPLVQEFVVIHSKDDSSIPVEQGTEIAHDLKAELIITDGREHFSEPENAPYIFDLLKRTLHF